MPFSSYSCPLLVLGPRILNQFIHSASLATYRKQRIEARPNYSQERGENRGVVNRRAGLLAMSFQMLKELSAGKTVVDSWPLCEVLLTHDALYPGWLVLVPRRPDARELYDLSAGEQVELIQEINKACRVVQKAFSPDKLNVGALGNVVAQLHIHVVPRFEKDKAWPGPVWGAHPSEEFQQGDLEATISKIKAAIKGIDKKP